MTSRNWTKCLGQDLETAMRDGGLKFTLFVMYKFTKVETAGRGP